jgi:lipoyl(octanoyl) transferase
VSGLVYVGFGASPVDYRQGWELQRRVHARRVAGEVPDSCLLLEHDPVYTAGKRTAASDRPFGDPGAPVIDVDRGGKITWHGPGQLTGYPIIKLRDPVDVVAYVRALEEAMIRVCAEFGVIAGRVAGRSGAWITGGPADGPDGDQDGGPGGEGWAERKVGAIGARVAKGVTMHGFALNCDCDLSWYDRIVPCGIRDAGVSTLSIEAGRRITVAEVTPVVQRQLAEVLGYRGWRVVDDAEALTDRLSALAGLGTGLVGARVSRCAGYPARGLVGAADLDGGAVGADLLADVLQFVHVEPHRQDRVRTFLRGGLDQPVLRLGTASRQQLGHPPQLAARQRLERGP